MDDDLAAGQDLGDPDTQTPLAFALTARDRAALGLVRDALRRRDVLLAFQPVVQSQDPTRVAFHEGLIRVLDPAGRVIPARQFIAAAETTEAGRILDSLALELGLDVLERVPDLRISVNMSARSIAYPRWTEALHRALDRDPSLAERLILEITEASAMIMPDITAHFMKRLQARGISFALDDFGAGFTSFRYLRDFTFDAVKIDGQFTRNIHADADNQCLARALTSIAEHFDMFTIAEAVETPEDAAFLTGLGFDCLQGYLYGAPTTRPPWQRQLAGTGD
mgnify:FL=1